MTVIEVFFKAGFLRPVVYGPVHSDAVAVAVAVADVVVNATLSHTGFVRYDALLKNIYRELVGKDLNSIGVKGSTKSIRTNAFEAQAIRNRVVHAGY